MVDIKKAINESNMSIVELADRLGVSRQTVHYHISQADKNSVETLKKIAKVLDIKVKDLIYEQEETDAQCINDDVIVCPNCGKRFKAID